MTPVADLSAVVQVSRCHGSPTSEFRGRKKKWVLHKCELCKQHCAVVTRTEFDRARDGADFRREIDVWMDEVQEAGRKRREIEEMADGIRHVPKQYRETRKEELIERHRKIVDRLDRLKKIGVQKGWVRS